MLLLVAVNAQAWKEQSSCKMEDEANYLAYDLKLIQDPGLYVGLLETSDCANFCNEKRTELDLTTEVTCCLQAKYWYQWYDLWAADCALIGATEMKANEDEWNAEEGLYTTFNAFILEADVVYVEQTISNFTSTPPSFVAQVQNQPSDWRENMKWNDGEFCDVKQSIWDDALVQSEPNDVENR